MKLTMSLFISTQRTTSSLGRRPRRSRRSRLAPLGRRRGPRHVAEALGVPTVVIMGPTDPRFTESNLDRSTVLRVEDLDCSPCHLTTCPLTHHRCMTWIEPDQVMAAAADLLERFPPESALTSEDE